MIKHFLKRDFQDSLAVWIIISGLTLLFLMSYLLWPSPNLIWALGYLYFLFSMFQTGGMLGSIVRSDHTISRHYFLTLPLQRNKMFYVVIVRAFVFYIPLWLYLIFIAPLTLREHFGQWANLPTCYVTYVFGVTLILFWFLAQGILHSIIMERSWHFSSSRKRVLSALIPGLVASAEIVIFFACFGAAISVLSKETAFRWLDGLFILLCFLIPTLIAVITFRLARSRWTSVS